MRSLRLWGHKGSYHLSLLLASTCITVGCAPTRSWGTVRVHHDPDTKQVGCRYWLVFDAAAWYAILNTEDNSGALLSVDYV